MYLYTWIGRYIHSLYMHANISTKVSTVAIAPSQAPSFRRCGVVLSCVSFCEREACVNNETNVRLRNLCTTTHQVQPAQPAVCTHMADAKACQGQL